MIGKRSARQARLDETDELISVSNSMEETKDRVVSVSYLQRALKAKRARRENEEGEIEVIASIDNAFPTMGNFEGNSKNSDYLKSVKIGEILGSAEASWFSVPELEDSLLKKLNADFELGEDPHILNSTPDSKYLKVKCKYAKCPFESWFTADKTDESDQKFKLCRRINQNHSVAAHCKKTLKLYLQPKLEKETV